MLYLVLLLGMNLCKRRNYLGVRVGMPTCRQAGVFANPDSYVILQYCCNKNAGYLFFNGRRRFLAGARNDSIKGNSWGRSGVSQILFPFSRLLRRNAASSPHYINMICHSSPRQSVVRNLLLVYELFLKRYV